MEVSEEKTQVGTPKPRSYPRIWVTPLPLAPRSLWPACHDSVTSLCFPQGTAEELAQLPHQDTQALGPCWEPIFLGTLGPRSLDRDSKNMQTQTSQKHHSLKTPGTPLAPPRRRPRKQPNPCQGSEKVDSGFEGVTLKFQIKPDSSLQITPTYSLACSIRSHRPPACPTEVPEAHPEGSEALGPRRCASCRTHRTPLWRDAEDGTPLCNACGIRYKKYGIRCSNCWLVPRKSVQPRKLCGRCGVTLGPHQSPVHEG
ncbi:LOW QUALITY PROTEIN: GATA-type zinc finger protein 1 [Otolemur garnettii]|nr:LOW QUALITY PROTEIN: GATA-type zinc finger protein 1 [Otolemur garnettii]